MERALSGDRTALEAILLLYMPLINRYSRIDGELDEDLRQYILLHVVTKIGEFKT
ncbi:MAG TPA: helix-turn-helix domain-containing protein [Candidatus Scatomorpha merdigallinarum]|nr:helix-turn-helix domain-containing protein [Candidatus Scatomorpha merdigallinarum]